MTSSDALVRQMYEELDARDRAVVDEWRGLGNDLFTSLMRARVLGDGPRRHVADDIHEFARRSWSGDYDVEFRTTCEHEAAHAVVARHLPGVTLVDVVARLGGGGLTRFRTPSDQASATVYAAADQWVHGLRCHVLPAGNRFGCGDDRQRLLRHTGGDPFRIREAETKAFRILRENHTEVLAFAELLGQANGEPMTFGG
ncbi:hypothetical protein [Actinomadura fibrosa]|uniref:Uncharacterized protein n=1 Tax=Actinomadura fibrosa TaxID=111802 RepID=A0ABW2XHC5_9ACTN|nr:hypothetical protein [Actinomadura fibrosa]